MNKTIWDATARRSLIDRLETLQPTARPLWGRFSAHAMVVHLVDSARMALGTLPTRRTPGVPGAVGRMPGVRHMLVYVLPFPRNAPTARELLTYPQGNWDADRATFLRLTEELVDRSADPHATWPEHPFFGPLNRRDWGVLGYRHTDHHLRQFGL